MLSVGMYNIYIYMIENIKMYCFYSYQISRLKDAQQQGQGQTANLQKEIAVSTFSTGFKLNIL